MAKLREKVLFTGAQIHAFCSAFQNDLLYKVMSNDVEEKEDLG